MVVWRVTGMGWLGNSSTTSWTCRPWGYLSQSCRSTVGLHFSFVAVQLFFILTSHFSPSSSVFFVLFHSCCSHARVFVKELWMSSTFPLAILSGACMLFSDSASALLLLLLKKVGNARLAESDWHSVSPKTPSPQHQSTEWKKREGKQQATKSEQAARPIKRHWAWSWNPPVPHHRTRGH